MNPEGMIFSNVGADVPVEKALEAVELLEAQALQIHVNSPQELVMPEGNREFVTWLDNIASIVSRVSVPVIIKEVGFGMSKELMHDLQQIGVKYVDVSGKGGTNFVDIEMNVVQIKIWITYHHGDSLQLNHYLKQRLIKAKFQFSRVVVYVHHSMQLKV